MNNGGRDATLVGMISQAKANALSSGSTTSNVPEGTNLYFTAARARSVLSADYPIMYNPSTGIIDLDTMWDDLRAPASSINPVGSLTPPSIDSSDGSLLFSTNDTVAIWFQLPHAWKEGTELRPHLHWAKTTTGAGIPNWQMKYKFANAGDVFPAFSSLVSSTVGVSDSNTINKHALSYFPSIDATGKLISSMLCVVLQRTSTGDTYGADAKLLEFDIHYQVDSTGSRQEYIK